MCNNMLMLIIIARKEYIYTKKKREKEKWKPRDASASNYIDRKTRAGPVSLFPLRCANRNKKKGKKEDNTPSRTTRYLE